MLKIFKILSLDFQVLPLASIKLSLLCHQDTNFLLYCQTLFLICVHKMKISSFTAKKGPNCCNILMVLVLNSLPSYAVPSLIERRCCREHSFSKNDPFLSCLCPKIYARPLHICSHFDLARHPIEFPVHSCRHFKRGHQRLVSRGMGLSKYFSIYTANDINFNHRHLFS